MNAVTNIIPFDQGKVPAHIRARMQDLDLSVNSSLGVAFDPIARLSLEGKKFTVIAEGKETIINDPRTDEPASSIQVVILRANPGNNRAYFTESFKKGVKATPGCFSNDGIRPDPQATDPQAKSCAMCPHNRFGSAIGPDGLPGKGKACSESKQIAVAAPDRLDRPMMLRVPPTSLKNLTQYGRLLAGKGVTFQLVATKIGFDPKVTHQLLTFTPVGFLSDEVVEGVYEIKDDESILRLTGEARIESDEVVEDAPAPVARVAPKPAPAARVAPKPAPVVEEEAEEEEDVQFQPPAKKKAAVRRDTPAAAAPADDLEDAIGDFLNGGFDDA